MGARRRSLGPCRPLGKGYATEGARAAIDSGVEVSAGPRSTTYRRNSRRWHGREIGHDGCVTDYDAHGKDTGLRPNSNRGGQLRVVRAFKSAVLHRTNKKGGAMRALVLRASRDQGCEPVALLTGRQLAPTRKASKRAR